MSKRIKTLLITLIALQNVLLAGWFYANMLYGTQIITDWYARTGSMNAWMFFAGNGYLAVLFVLFLQIIWVPFFSKQIWQLGLQLILPWIIAWVNTTSSIGIEPYVLELAFVQLFSTTLAFTLLILYDVYKNVQGNGKGWKVNLLQVVFFILPATGMLIGYIEWRILIPDWFQILSASLAAIPILNVLHAQYIEQEATKPHAA